MKAIARPSDFKMPERPQIVDAKFKKRQKEEETPPPTPPKISTPEPEPEPVPEEPEPVPEIPFEDLKHPPLPRCELCLCVSSVATRSHPSALPAPLGLIASASTR